MRVDVDGDEMVLILIQRNLEWVKNEADVGFFQTVEGNEFFLELGTQDFFGSVEGGTHSNLEGAGTDDSSAFKAGMLACWFDH